MKLKIRAVGPNDFGTYRCVAKNSLGETDGNIKLDGEWHCDTFIYIHTYIIYIYTIYSAHTLHAIYVFFIHFNSLIYCILFVCMNKWKTKWTDRAAVASDVRVASCQFPGRPFFVLIVERLTCDTRLKIALKCCMQISQSAVKSDFLNTSKSSFLFTL